MKKIGFMAICPYEIGDKVCVMPQIASETALYMPMIREITDIAITMYAKSGEIEFTYQLNHSGKYIRLKKEQEKRK